MLSKEIKQDLFFSKHNKETEGIFILKGDNLHMFTHCSEPRLRSQAILLSLKIAEYSHIGCLSLFIVKNFMELEYVDARMIVSIDINFDH